MWRVQMRAIEETSEVVWGLTMATGRTDVLEVDHSE